MTAGEQVVILGDFNAASPQDPKRVAHRPERAPDTKNTDDKNKRRKNQPHDGKEYPVIQTILDAGFIDVCYKKAEGTPLLKGTFPTKALTPDNADRLYRIDFIFTSPNLAEQCTGVDIPREGITNQISDHYPVVARFK